MTTETRMLSVALSEAEITARNLELQSKLVAIDEKRAIIKAEIARMKAELRELEQAANLLKQAIRTGVEVRGVTCTLTSITAVEVTRDDTHEVVCIQAADLAPKLIGD
jgi:uncharacterized small protein (DUF1192 family)